jgi:hypothetical protein
MFVLRVRNHSAMRCLSPRLCRTVRGWVETGAYDDPVENHPCERNTFIRDGIHSR